MPTLGFKGHQTVKYRQHNSQLILLPWQHFGGLEALFNAKAMYYFFSVLDIFVKIQWDGGAKN